MVGEDVDKPTALPKHPLFEGDTRWTWMLRSDSYYFAGDTHSTIRFDDIGKCFYLCIRCNLKNYDEEIEHFINWIMPYLAHQPGDFLGFYRIEETQIMTPIHQKKT